MKALTSFMKFGEQDKIEITVRDDAKRLRTKLREEIERKLKSKNKSGR